MVRCSGIDLDGGVNDKMHSGGCAGARLGRGLPSFPGRYLDFTFARPVPDGLPCRSTHDRPHPRCRPRRNPVPPAARPGQPPRPDHRRTGTGKTITLQKLAEGFSAIGVPVFMADIKGDLTGISQTGQLSAKVAGILKERGLAEPEPTACPTTLWDVFGEQGHPVRATVSDMGPLLLGRMLDLNDTQQGVLQLVFKIADDNGLLLLDPNDLRAMLQHVGDNAKNFTTEYGNLSPASVASIQRGLLQVEDQGGDRFFGEPMLGIAVFVQKVRGQGVINILAADKLMNAPRLYATFLLWMLSELFETLPEVGDLDKPKLVFFFDEAHLLFKDAPSALIERIELVVRLVRSKGVGVYFVT